MRVCECVVGLSGAFDSDSDPNRVIDVHNFAHLHTQLKRSVTLAEAKAEEEEERENESGREWSGSESIKGRGEGVAALEDKLKPAK